MKLRNTSKNYLPRETIQMKYRIRITPETMKPPFTGTEVYNNSCKLKNNKSPPDNAEMVKYAPIEISNEIANIYNIMAETGESADAIRRGILHPIPKPPKKDTKVNVRPISLLSVLRNFLALCMIERCWDRMKQVIPKDQAAYQVGRSTTEQVFALKVMAEKAIISEKYEIFFILLVMSKAFDTVSREELLTMLSDFLTNSELHIMKMLIMDVILNVKVGDTIGIDILTGVGIPNVIVYQLYCS